MKKIFVLLISLVLIILVPSVSAQLTLGGPAEQKLVEITISEQGEVHVYHEIEKSRSAVNVNLIEGTISNLMISDVEGNEVEHGTTGLETATGVTIFSSEDDVIIEYDLDDVLFLENGWWTWNFVYFQTTVFVFPKSVDLVFVNERPVLLQDAKGITCHGCEARIEYSLDEPKNIKQVQWEDRKFFVEIRTSTEISSFDFEQPTKSINFNINEENQFVTLIIPLELLWNPYEVYLDNKKILKHEFFSNETHSWLNIRPENSGTIQIIGTTVIPEFPIFIPLFVGIAAVLVLQLRNRFNPH